MVARAFAILPALLAGILAAGGCQTGENTSEVAVSPPQQPPGQSHCDVPPGGHSNQSRLAAMLSVQANALFSPQELGTLHLNALPLAEAVQVLRCERGPAADSRRRRAVAKLFAYGNLGTRFAHEIVALGADPEAIRAALEQQYPVTLPIIERDAATLDMVVFNLLPGLLGEPPGTAPPPPPPPPGASTSTSLPPPPDQCESRKESPDFVLDTGTSFTMTVKISVAPPLRDVAGSLDPRRWDNCSKFWDPPEDATYLSALGTDGKPQQTGGGCTSLKDSGTGPSPGDDLGPTGLYEHFAFSGSGISASFDTVLSVSAKRDDIPLLSDSYLLGYSLANGGSLCGEIVNVRPTGVTTDQGRIFVWEDGGRRIVEFTKKVEYSSLTTTGIAAAVVAHSELAGELTEVACCLK